MGEAVVVPDGKVMYESNPGSGIAFLLYGPISFMKYLISFLVAKRPIRMEFQAA